MAVAPAIFADIAQQSTFHGSTAEAEISAASVVDMTPSKCIHPTYGVLCLLLVHLLLQDTG